MSNFLRDLAIAKFPRFGIVYNVKVLDEPELLTNKWGKSNVKLKLAFYSLEAPPQHLQDRVVTLPLWKAGELLDLLEQGNDHLEKLPVIAIELHKRNDTDEYGTLRLRLDLQPALDAFTGEPVADVDAHGGPSIASTSELPRLGEQQQRGVQATPTRDVGGGQPTEGEAVGVAAKASPSTPCPHPPLDRITIDSYDLQQAGMRSYQCSVCSLIVVERVG